jgi:hypothetical protein
MTYTYIERDHRRSEKMKVIATKDCYKELMEYENKYMAFTTASGKVMDKAVEFSSVESKEEFFKNVVPQLLDWNVINNNISKKRGMMKGILIGVIGSLAVVVTVKVIKKAKTKKVEKNEESDI